MDQITTTKDQSRKTKKKKRARLSTKIFYTSLLVLILLFGIALTFVMRALQDWLVDFEASQPDAKRDEVFAQLFSDPDWQALYTMSGEADSDGVDAQSYAAYMEQKIDGRELTCIETSAGLSGDKKYIVRCDNEKVATFTLSNATPDASIPNWNLGTVEVFYSCDLSVNIITVPGYTVTVNSQTLDESHVIRTESTKAEEYLPDGVHGYQLCEMTLDNLLIEPEVQVLDLNGAPVELSYDADSHTYSHTIAAQQISDTEYQTLLNAAKTYCEYMIEKATRAELRQYFDSESEIYNTITTNTTWMQNFSSYEFGAETITDFYRYTDGLYSAKVQLVLNVTRGNGSVKEYNLNNTFFVEKQGETWRVTNMINSDAQEPVHSVRLTYTVNGETISSQLVDAESLQLTPPAVTVPEGKTFAGWFVERVDDSGKTVLELAFLPGEDGIVHLSADNVLEPMILQALFQ